MVKVPIQILLVDDERDFTEMLAARLEQRGHKVQVAFDGPGALEILEQHTTIEVVVLDVLMPGMDGITTLKKIKAGNPLVEVILLSGHGTVDAAVEGMKNGAFDYVLKPADFQELLDKLETARERRAEQEERIRQAQARSLTRRTGDV